MSTLDFPSLQHAEAAIHSTRAAVHEAYRRHSAALRRGDGRAAVAASLDACDAMREHAVAFGQWLDAARP